MQASSSPPHGPSEDQSQSAVVTSPEDQAACLIYSKAQLSAPLLRLSDDVLLDIVNEISNISDLRALSRACIRLNALCKPQLFKVCSTKLTRASAWRRGLPPTSLWPYIRDLRFDNDCPHSELMIDAERGPIRYPPGPIKYTPNVQIGSMFDSLIIDRTLHNMHALQSVCLQGCPHNDAVRDGVYDISLAALESILSVPHLREFKMVDHVIFWPGPDSDDAKTSTNPVAPRPQVEHFAPVASFVYEVGMAGVPPGYPADFARQALSMILRRLAPSLEILQLPPFYAPIEALRTAEWPRLRELTLQGEHPEPSGPSPSSPLAGQSSLPVSSFVNMPNLRVLNLELTCCSMLWPAGSSAPFPWPELEHLTLSYPSPNDGIYAHLPRTLRGLSLRSWPTQAYDEHLDNGEMSLAAWDRMRRGSPLSTSTVNRVLRACGEIAGDLTRLHVEYVADEQEAALLQCITSSFPSLAVLEVHRCRPEHMVPGPSWHLETLGKACSALTHLRALYVHADLPNYPDQIWVSRRDRLYTNEQHKSYAETELLELAAALARTLAPSVHTLAFLTPDNYWPRWAIYSVRTLGDGDGKDTERTVRYVEHREARR